MTDFVHLHVHTEYSLLDGLTKVKDLVKRVKEMEMNAVAITDHGNMYGAIEFYKECNTNGIKPIIGMEGYVVNDDHKIKEGNKANNHIILLAKNNAGYRNLMKISSIANLEGYYYRPRICKEYLKKYSEGIICSSACIMGEIGQFLTDGNYEKAKEAAIWYQEVFGENNYFLEIQRHHYKDFIEKAAEPKIKEELRGQQKAEDIWVAGIIKLSRELGIPLIATNDSHYLKKSDSFTQDVLVCISTGKLVTDLERLRYVDSPSFHLCDQQEMENNFLDVSDSIKNTAKVAQMIDIKIEIGKWYFPNISIPEGKNAVDYFSEQAKENLLVKFPKADESIKERLQYEIDVINKKGYATYFLLMAGLVNWCTEHGIITNTRGSAAGSLVSYSLGITTVDPLKYQLPFERFLNPFRPKPPDIDLDIADDRREELISYITKNYGEDKVAQVCTFGRMLARGSVRDVGRVLGHPYSVPDKISKLIPLGSQGFPMTLKHAIEITAELKAMYDSDPEVKKILDLAQEIEGNARHSSVHAAGIIVSPTEMTDYTPLQLEPNGSKIITQYEMHACEDVGLVKFDILGIRNLSILGAAVDVIEKSTGKKVDFQHLPLDDKKTFEMLSKGETMGVFQLGGAGMTKWLKELRPNRIEDLMVMIALFRPGPLANIPEYIARKNKQSQVTYLHPKMEKYLDKSYGILVYQEDILFTALEVAGYNWETVDKLRNAIGKKIPEEMAKQHKIFVDGCQKNSNMTEEESERVWDLFVPFQGYGFNKAHAASYGMVSYQTAYLKAHYPVEYMTALLTAESGDTDKIVEGIAECKRMGIVVLPPDINYSKSGFSIEDNEKSVDKKAIRFGLNAIKNVGEAALGEILNARSGGEFKSFCDFYLRVNGQKVNKKVLESLIKVGAMSSFGKRSSLLSGLDQMRNKCDLLLKQRTLGQTSLFSGGQKDEMTYVPKDELPQIDELKDDDLMQMEKELLGFYLSNNPLAGKLALLDSTVDIKIRYLDSYINEEGDGRVKIGGILSSLRFTLTKKSNSEMAFGTLEDETGSIDLVIFPKVYSEGKSIWIKDKVVIVEGRVETTDRGKSFGDEQDPAAVRLTMIVEKGYILSEDKENGHDYTIRVPKGTSSEKLMELNRLLKSRPGGKIGLIIFENGKGAKKMVLSFGVEYDDLLAEEIAKLLEKEA